MRPEIGITDIIGELERHSLLPAIVFRTARSQCDSDVERLSRHRSLELGVNEQRRLRERIFAILKAYEVDPEIVTTHPQYSALVRVGAGAHHAGQLLIWRLILEELMSEGLLRALIATGTVAAGVDFPARTVVITAHSRRGAEGFQTLSPSELQQMSGRAGRRGKDTVGFCLVAPTVFCNGQAVLRISKRPPEPLRSAYFPSASTVLNLLRYRNVDDLRYTVERSLASFGDRRSALQLREESAQLTRRLDLSAEELRRENAEESMNLSREVKKKIKRARRLIRQAEELEGRQLQSLEQTLHGLRELGYLERESLSEKGTWAANLFTTYVLELGEMVEERMLHAISTEKLVAIIASICGDPHRNYFEQKLDVFATEDVARVNDILQRVAKLNMPGTSSEREALPAAASTVVTWLRCEGWQEFRSLLLLSGVAEGDAARLITQTAEQLNQLTKLSDTHSQLALRAEEGKRLLLRPPLTDAIQFVA